MSEVAGPAAGCFATPSEYRQAIDRLVQAARRRICVFDRDLGGAGFDDPRRIESIRRLLLNSRDSRLQWVLHDVRPVERGHPRLLALLRQFSHAMEIRETGPQARGVYDGIMIVDEIHYVHRFHFDHPRGEWVLNDSVRSQTLQRRFDEIWEASTVALTATVLGL